MYAYVYSVNKINAKTLFNMCVLSNAALIKLCILGCRGDREKNQCK